MAAGGPPPRPTALWHWMTAIWALTDYGLAYSCDGERPAPGPARYSFHHLFGPWYTFTLVL